jgi:hypothetical protein
MQLPQHFVDELLAQTPLPTVVGKSVRLAKSGRQWKGCCPFHGEKTPSFYVYDDHYHCFGCGVHGNAIDFLVAVESITYGAAAEKLAAEVGLQMPALPGAKGKPVTVPSPTDTNGPTTFHESAKGVTIFQGGQFDAVLGTAAMILVREKNVLAASILANGKTALRHWDHDNWDGGIDTWRLYVAIPTDTYLEL